MQPHGNSSANSSNVVTATCTSPAIASLGTTVSVRLSLNGKDLLTLVKPLNFTYVLVPEVLQITPKLGQ